MYRLVLRQLALIIMLCSTYLYPQLSQSRPILTNIQQAVHTDIAGPISDYLISEKLDGVRGFWDGRQMSSRSGRLIAIPDWFVDGFPTYPLDGELWMGRGTFEQMSSLARRKEPIHAQWRKVKFMVFDMPAHPGSFVERYTKASKDLTLGADYIVLVEQKRLENQHQLDTWFSEVVVNGGEGLMLHQLSSLYIAGRNSNLIKYKPYYDAEARVIAYQGGKGKLAGVMGSLLVENHQGVRFKLGTGFSMKERKHPPEIGSTVTYQYSGLTQKGTPRFARFLRVRPLE
ncbi:DNA ligase [Shewanella violacea]|uniref:DNA ligase, ATP-dependent n=1 Tax=Shewanella violacea (strain JCM 10179 / CIP 106290 / LMG 19151 / DSS12) TaxID=637905 RepID=D4ZLI4_SHEVD|nr:DNA ligase [Shewanella violacea]BAJ02533.1 DNA ligase, ATP-dependent [Shewanella violacea DSS12]